MERLRLLRSIGLGVLGIALGSTVARAQTPPTFPHENHYKVYLPNEIYVHDSPIRLDDQWETSQHQVLTLRKFANPVSKNGSVIYNPAIHHTWWFFHDGVTVTPRTVQLDNQFGRQTWTTYQSIYLLLPAAKSLVPPPPDPLPPGAANHYKCYAADGPQVDVPVTLVDQFGTSVATAMFPRYFCNPVAKTIASGLVYPIVDPEAHLACYSLFPSTSDQQYNFFATDQFGQWPLTTQEFELICLPTTKLHPIGIEPGTWGKVKILYK
jgi:hypothetical protein